MNQKFQTTYEFSLASYIATAITLLVLFSTLIISGVLYYRLNNSLTIQFEERVKAESREVGQALSHRFRSLESKVKALSLDNTIRVTLMLGAHQQLDNHLKTIYSDSPEFNFHLLDDRRVKYFSAQSLQTTNTDLIDFFSLSKSKIHLYNQANSQGVKLAYKIPVTRQQERIGTAVGEYRFNRDVQLKSIVESSHQNMLILVQDNSAWNLLTGIPFDAPKNINITQDRQLAIKRVSLKDTEYAAIPCGEIDGIFFLADIAGLNEARMNVLQSIVLPAISIMIFTILISYLLSKKIARPIKELSRIAATITTKNNQVPSLLESSSIREVDTLQDSFLTMLQSLKLSRENEQYQELFNGVADIVIIHSVTGKIVEVNHVASEKLGFTADTFITRHFTDLVPGHLLNQLIENLGQLQANISQTYFTTELTTVDGHSIPVECHARKIRYKNMDVVLSVVRDISARLEAEQAIGDSHRILHTILDSIKATIYVADIQNHTVLFMNQFMKDEFGGDFVGQKCFEVFRNSSHPCSHCCGQTLIEAADWQNNIVTWEAQNPKTERWYLNTDRLIQWTDGSLVKFQIAFDISEMKELELQRIQAESELRQIQKMQAVGTLAGGVAHDLNNILSGMVSYPEILLMDMKEDDPLKPHLLTIKDTGIKAAAIVQDLLTLARRGVVSNRVVNLNGIISNYLTSPEFKRLDQIHPEVEVQTELESDLCNILGSSVHLEKTIMNLISNGVESITGKGMVKISTSTRRISQSESSKEKVAGEYVILTISDNGCGISTDAKERIFEPFFTTKIMGRSGTGLGMAVVWGTVEDHGGYIELDSVLDQGTTFTLYFPMTRKDLVKEQLAHKPLELEGKGESVLIIDDVREQRSIGTMILSQLGYNAIAVSSGTEAIEYLKSHSVALILLDMIMDPGPGGLETYKEILKIHPDQKAIITTGYSNNEDVQEVLSLGAGKYVKKPYQVTEIAAAVRSELDK